MSELSAMDDIPHSSSTGDDAGGEGAGVEAGVDPSISDVSSAPPPSGGIVLEMSQETKTTERCNN